MPYAVGIDVTSRCNLHCWSCAWHSPDSPVRLQPVLSREELDWELFQNLCEQLRTLGTRKMILIGKGEPLLHRHLADMIQKGKEAGLHVRLVTNGTLVDQEWADRFVRLGLDELQVSLWASNEIEYSQNYPGTDSGSFHKVCAGLKSVAQARKESGEALPKVILHRPITKKTFRTIPHMLEIARGTGIDAISFSPLKPMGQNIEHEELNPAEELELGELLRGIVEKAKKYSIQTNIPEVLSRYAIGKKVWEKYPCYIGWVDVRIHVNGDVNPCSTCNIVIGNIRESRLREIWNSPSCQGFREIGRNRRTNRQLTGSCFCEFCCHVLTNARMDRFLRWIPSTPRGGTRSQTP